MKVSTDHLLGVDAGVLSLPADVTDLAIDIAALPPSERAVSRRQAPEIKQTAVTIGRDVTTGKPICKYCYGKTKGEVQQKKDTQYRLGHSTTQMLLNVYTHRISGGQEQIASWLNASFPVASLTHETSLQ